MRSNCIRERAAEATNHDRVGSLFHFCESAESGENCGGSFGSLAKRSGQRRLIFSETLSNVAENYLEIVGGHSIAQCFDQTSQNREIRLREISFRGFGKLVDHCRPSSAWSGSHLMCDAIPL